MILLDLLIGSFFGVWVLELLETLKWGLFLPFWIGLDASHQPLAPRSNDEGSGLFCAGWFSGLNWGCPPFAQCCGWWGLQDEQEGFSMLERFMRAALLLKSDGRAKLVRRCLF